jgi:hypothetical protein
LTGIRILFGLVNPQGVGISLPSIMASFQKNTILSYTTAKSLEAHKNVIPYLHVSLVSELQLVITYDFKV